MGFSNEWEEQYANNHQMSIWPWSDLVSYVMRYTDIRQRKLRVLELGCGAGANISLFDSLKADYYAIEGSSTIVKALHDKFPQYKDTIIVGDFTKNIPFDLPFDLVVDRSSLTHNTTKDIRNTIEMVYDALNKDGKYIGIDWFSTKHCCSNLGQNMDEYTKYNFKEGQFVGVGNVHFSNKKHVLDLFSKFRMEVLEEKIIEREIPKPHIFASWNFVAKK